MTRLAILLLGPIEVAYADYAKVFTADEIKKICKRVARDVGEDPGKKYSVMNNIRPGFGNLETQEDRKALRKLIARRLCRNPRLNAEEFVGELTKRAAFNCALASSYASAAAIKLQEALKASQPIGVPTECPRCTNMTAHITYRLRSEPGGCGGKATRCEDVVCINCGPVHRE